MTHYTIKTYKTSEFPLDVPVNSYLIEELRVLIDTGTAPPDPDLYDYVYITHWHWDHVMGLSRMQGKRVCMPSRTIELFKTQAYSDRFLTVLRAGGVQLTPYEREFIKIMEKKYKGVVEAFHHNTILPLDECPHLKSGEIRVLECPGHSLDHVCYLIGSNIFVGDTLLPRTRSTIIHFREHRETIIRMFSTEWRTLYPGHGEPLTREDAGSIAVDYTVRRCTRPYRILQALSKRPMNLRELLREVYGLEPGLASFVALRTMIGYLNELESEGIISVNRTSSPWLVTLRK